MSAAKRNTRVVVVWGLLAVLGASIAYIEWSDRKAAVVEEAAQKGARDPKMLVPVFLDELGAIEIAQGGTIHRFERDQNGAWFYHGAHAAANAGHAHQTDLAMAERIQKALEGFERARRERSFPLTDGGKNFGVATPQMVILVYRPKEIQPLAQYAVGDLAPDNVSRYVLPVGEPEVRTIASYQIDNLLNLIKMVNDASAASPAASPASTPNATPAASPASGSLPTPPSPAANGVPAPANAGTRGNR